MLAIASLLMRQYQWSVPFSISKSSATTRATTRLVNGAPDSLTELGPRHQLNYQQWVSLLEQEAQVTAAQKPEHLAILMGDSISLWFPNELLPSDRSWLNQGISGETSAGLLNRLEVVDKTKPEVIFVMIGINDLIGGVKDETILANQQLIISYLRQVHPKAKIVVQSILPHGGEKVTWEGRDRLLAIPNSRIQELNHRLRAIARKEGVIYIDLYPLFADDEGNLKRALSTDGLHLSHQGYLVWRNALLVLNQLIVEPTALK